MIKLALTVVGVAVAIAQHPVVRAGVRAVADNPELRDRALKATMAAAYTAGVVARRIIPRSIIQ